jgi:hypothetical protein
MADSGVDAIVKLFKEREEAEGARNSSYDEVLQFYSGNTFQEAKKQGFLSGIANALTSIFTPDVGDEDAELTTPINLVKPAIENKVAFLALPPTIRVIEPPDKFAPMEAPPGGPGMPGNDPAAMGQIPEPIPGAAPMEGPDGQEAIPAAPPGPPPVPMEGGQPLAPGPTNADWGLDFADRLQNVIESLLAFSNMPQRCRDVAWSMCAMDGAVIGVWPDLRHGRPRIITRTPQDFYPIAYDPDGLDLKVAMWKDTLSGAEIVARYGDKFLKDYDGRPEVDVIYHIDEKKFSTVLDEKEWAHPPMDNMAGIVPFVCVGALGLPGMIFGSTDIKDAIPVAKQINKHMYLVEEMAAAMIRPTIAVKDPLEVPDDIAIGRGGLMTMGPNGSVELLGPIQLPSAFWGLASQLENWFNIIADNPDALRSVDGGGMTTGKGFNAKLGPIGARMQQRLEILMSAWRQAIKYMLIMWANFPGMKSVTASGVKMKESFYLDATPEEFKVNGEIWTEIDVFLEAQAYIDRQGNAVEIMQLYQNELLDWDTAVDNLHQVKNRKKTRSNIDKDRQWKAEGLATAQAAAQSPMTANPSMAAQPMTEFGLETGFKGETGPPPGPEGMMGEGAPMEGGPMGGAADGEVDTAAEVISLMQEFFTSIEKLKGSVWFGGDPVTSPEKFSDDSWTVTVWVTDPLDQGTITRAAEKVDVLYGRLRFKRGEPGPSLNAIQVAGTGEDETDDEMLLGGEVPMGEAPLEGAPQEEDEIAMMLGGQ